jgi:hypothetical protein
VDLTRKWFRPALRIPLTSILKTNNVVLTMTESGKGGAVSRHLRLWCLSTRTYTLQDWRG